MKRQEEVAHVNEKESTPASTIYYTRCAKVKEERLNVSASARSMSEDEPREAERTGLRGVECGAEQDNV